MNISVELNRPFPKLQAEVVNANFDRRNKNWAIHDVCSDRILDTSRRHHDESLLDMDIPTPVKVARKVLLVLLMCTVKLYLKTLPAASGPLED